jgi:hypothetical protein
MINQTNNFQNSENNTAQDYKGANIGNLNNYFVAESILSNLFFKSYFEFRSRKGISLDITVFKLIRAILYSVSALFFIFTIAIFFLASNNALSVEHSTNSIIFTFCISLVLALTTFFHWKIENEFENNKDIIKLELKDCDKGRFYFKIDCVLFIVLFISIIFI